MSLRDTLSETNPRHPLKSNRTTTTHTDQTEHATDNEDTMNTNNNSETSNTPSTQLWKGHQISHHTHELFTIGFSNINGLANASKQSLQTNLRDIAATLHHHNIALLGISEHHLAMNNPKTKQQIYELERQIHKTMHTKFYLQSSQETTPDNKRLMGGTGIIAVQQTIGRLDTNNSGGDSLGRWTYVNFRNNNGRTLTVVSVYQVCQNPKAAEPPSVGLCRIWY